MHGAKVGGIRDNTSGTSVTCGPPKTTFAPADPDGVRHFICPRSHARHRADMSTLPVIDTTVAANNGTITVPHFADGGGWTTNVFLVNPTDDAMTGAVQFLNPAGAAVNVTIGGQTSNSFAYSIPKRTSQKFSTSGLLPTTVTGSIRIVPTGGGAGPTPLVVFSNKPGAITVS